MACLSPIPAEAATGGPDSAGYVWADNLDGCSTIPSTFGAGAQIFPGATTMQGPFPLGFVTTWFGVPVSEAWVSPHGYITFTAQPNAGAGQLLPNPALPNDLLAAHWMAADSAEITVESSPMEFHVRWVQSYVFIGRATTDLHFTSDGGARIVWGNQLPPPTAVTVGYEDASGIEGKTLYQRQAIGVPERDGDFPDPSGGWSACLSLTTTLDCLDEALLDCGDSVSSSLPGVTPTPASGYACDPRDFAATERVFRVDVPTATPLSAVLDNAAFDLLYVGTSCNETGCLAAAPAGSLDFPVLLPGTHHFVVDAEDVAAAGNFEFATDCSADFATLDCGGTVSGATSGQSGIDSYACTGVALTGPEQAFRITLPTAAPLAVAITAGDPDLWVLLFDETGSTCVGAGVGGAAYLEAAAGTYLVVVDGANGVSGAFTLQSSCEAQLDCGPARDLFCATPVMGDTSMGMPGASLYSCGGGPLTGAEQVYRFVNPVQQTLSATFLQSQPGQRLLLLEDCSEGRCKLLADDDFSCALLEPGLYYLVVDGPAGSEGPYEFELSCREVDAGLDLTVSAVDASELAQDCRSFDVDGRTFVTLANLSRVPAPAPFDVVVFEDDPSDANGTFEASDNLLGRLTVTTDLAPGATSTVAVPCVGTVLFRENVVHAVVDPEGVLAESDTADNYWDTGRGCEYRPPIGEFELREEWIWNSSTVLEDYVHVDTTPMVGDVNADGVTNVVINAGIDDSGYDEGVVRVLDGRNGAEIWTAEDVQAAMFASTSLAIGDLDGDPGLEIVGQGFLARDNLVAVDDDGSLLWISEPFIDHPSLGGDTVGGGGASLADLNCDGVPEVIYGANAFDGRDGTYFWTPEPGGTRGINGDPSERDGALSVVVDINGDGRMEVVAGPTAYANGAGVGRIVWNNPAVPDGLAAVGNFDGDPNPEIVIVASGRVYLLEGDTGDIIWDDDIPLGSGISCRNGVPARAFFSGGAPTVADFDGDCEPEIGVAGADLYTVFETDGSVRWSSPIDDCSSHRTSSTVFDFDGDGAAEVAFMDQSRLHVFRGTDGVEIASRPASSHTWQEMVSVADVDGDNNAEIIMPVNGGDMLDLDGDTVPETVGNGVWVIGDLDGDWVNTRRIWNQHAYHIDHVTEDGKIAGSFGNCEEPSWLEHGTYRDQLGSEIYSAPDITISIIEIEILLNEDCSRDVRIVARVGNGGGVPVGRSVNASFYDGDPSLGMLLTNAAIPNLSPGEFGDFEVRVPAPRLGNLEIWAVADDDGTGGGGGVVNECHEDNNDCLAFVDNSATGTFGNPPANVGWALRARDRGDAYAADCTVVMDWTLDEGLPRPDGNHYHVFRGEDPRNLFVVSTDPHEELSFDDSTPSRTDDLLVHYYRVLAVDHCGQVESGE